MHFCHYQTFFMFFLSTWRRQMVVPYIPGLALTIAAQTIFFCSSVGPEKIACTSARSEPSARLTNVIVSVSSDSASFLKQQ
jgi:hypothetical protein